MDDDYTVTDENDPDEDAPGACGVCGKRHDLEEGEEPWTPDEDITWLVDALEGIAHPEGRCAVCGGGKPYWKHDNAHLFQEQEDENA